jgi:hypothetical protein
LGFACHVIGVINAVTGGDHSTDIQAGARGKVHAGLVNQDHFTGGVDFAKDFSWVGIRDAV